MKKYEICYAIACDKGKARVINQDNFWCLGKYLKAENKGLAQTESGGVPSETNPAFAVFDGMGGEQYGEAAAYIAAYTFGKLRNEAKPSDPEKFLIDACRKMNNNITAYADKRHADCVGTTAAVLMCGDKKIYACNVGDSKIYRYHGGNLTQISKDHVLDIYKDRKPPLVQFLGVPETEFIIEPHTAREAYSCGDYYLICSDGLTDMLSADEIKDILSENKDVKICVDTLLAGALSRGGKDNITIILCKIQKRRDPFLKKLLMKLKAGAGSIK